MPVQIGAQAHSFSDATGLLSDRHSRIEMFPGSLRRVAEVIDRPPNGGALCCIGWRVSKSRPNSFVVGVIHRIRTEELKPKLHSSRAIGLAANAVLVRRMRGER